MRQLSVGFCVALIVASMAVRAEDEAKLADSLAESAAAFATSGRAEEAKLYYYKSLFHDSNCATALYALAKSYETANDNVNALNFFVRAGQEFNKNAAADPTARAKAKDCEKHILLLSPYTTQFNKMIEDYTLELGKIAAKNQDTLTQEEAGTKVTSLNLTTLVSPDKMPESLKDLALAKEKKAEQPRSRRFPMMGDSSPPPAAVMAPDVERALKAAGWTTIAGTIKKKSDGVYEITDGKLEAANANGAMQFIVQKGGTGTVRAFVRASRNEFIGDPDLGGATSKFAGSFPSGFGWIIKDTEAKQYTANGGWTDGENNNIPELDKTLPLAGPKTMFSISVQDNKLELSVNGASPRKMNNRITHEGPMQIVVTGTMVIEQPQTKGF